VSNQQHHRHDGECQAGVDQQGILYALFGDTATLLHDEIPVKLGYQPAVDIDRLALFAGITQRSTRARQNSGTDSGNTWLLLDTGKWTSYAVELHITFPVHEVDASSITLLICLDKTDYRCNRQSYAR